MPTILLVDDDVSVRAAVEDWLAGARFDVIAVPDTVAGLRELEAHPEIDLCLVDMVMPPDVPDGVELGRTIRSRWPHMPLILMTAYYSAAAERLADMKVVTVLYKPVDVEALIAEINRQLGSGSR
jgi:CheY-like chemotaxis protein